MRKVKFSKSGTRRVSKKFLAGFVSVTLLATGIAIPSLTDTKAQIPTDTNGDIRATSVFFNADDVGYSFRAWRFPNSAQGDDAIANREGDNLHNNDTYYQKISSAFTLDSSIDGRIVPESQREADGEGIVQIDYDARTLDMRDGTTTLWGFGGSHSYTNTTLKLTIKATDPDIAKYMVIRMDNSDGKTAHAYSDTIEMTLAKWMEDSGIADTTLPTDSFRELTLTVPSSAQGDSDMDGFKVSFNGADKAGTIWLKPLIWSSNAGKRDDFKRAATNGTMDADGYFPMVRYSNGTAGDANDGEIQVNKSTTNDNMTWVTSTEDANIVKNTYSADTKALQIRYQNTQYHNTWATLKKNQVQGAGEPVVAISLKGQDESGKLYGTTANVTVDDVLSIVLKNSSTGATKEIPFTDFATTAGYEHTSLTNGNYQTYYALTDGFAFDTVDFKFDKQAGNYAGSIWVQDIFFPEYKTIVRYNFSDTTNTDYTAADGFNEDATKRVTAYYKYSTAMAYDAPDTQTYNGKTYTLATKISDTHDINGVVITANGFNDNTDLQTDSKVANNIVDVYYVLPQYKVNYFKQNEDGTYPDTPFDTSGGTSSIGATETYEDKTPTPGFELDTGKTGDGTVTVTADNEANVINVYYKRSEYPYTINYHYKKADGTEVVDSVTTDETGGPLSATYGKQVALSQDNIDAHKSYGNVTYTYTSSNNNPLTITENANGNVIDIYYEVQPYNYKIEYYYDISGTDEEPKYHNVADDTYYPTENEAKKYGETVSADDLDGAKISAHEKAGYEYDKAENNPLTISDDEDANVIKIYYKKKTYPYTIEYYYDGKIDEAKTETVDTAKFESTVTLPEAKIDANKETGYIWTDTVNGTLTISDDATKNVIKVYYEKDNFSYKVEYYYDGVLGKTEGSEEDVTFGDTVEVKDSVIHDTTHELPGYKYEKSEDNPLTISEDAAKNVIKIYYVKDAFPYTVEYYYDGEKDDTKTTTGDKTTYGESVEVKQADIEKNTEDGYKYEKSENNPLTISEKTADNVIKIYYVKDAFPYTIEYYYDGTLGKTEQKDPVTFGTEIELPQETIDANNRPGYENTNVENGTLKIGSDPEKNVIKVYYDKDTIKYTVNYIFEDHDDYNQTVTNAAKMSDEVSYDEKRDNVTVYDGYILDTEQTGTGKLVVTENPDKNVINVYYKKNVYPYTVEYYYDGVLEKTEPQTAVPFETEITLDKATIDANNKQGYTNTNVENNPLTIGTDVDKNVIKVYYVKGDYTYTVNYIFEDDDKDNKTVTNGAKMNDEVSYDETRDGVTVPDGYELNKEKTGAGKTTVTDDNDKNVINVYYKKKSYPYTVEYYYDGVKDDTKTENKAAVPYKSEVSVDQATIDANNKSGYNNSNVENNPLTIGTDADKNVIKVYYVKGQYSYKINYIFEGSESDNKTIADGALLDEEIIFDELRDKITVPKGYRLNIEKTGDGTLTVGEDNAANVINVYYEKISYPYTIEYYTDGTDTPVKTETKDPTPFGDTVSVSDEDIAKNTPEGYKLDKTENNPLVIDTENNVIKVYYTKDTSNYKVEYYVDEALVETVQGTGTIGDVIPYSTTREGYNFSRVDGEGKTVTVVEEDNVVKVYFESVPEETTTEELTTEEPTTEETTTEETTTMEETTTEEETEEPEEEEETTTKKKVEKTTAAPTTTTKAPVVVQTTPPQTGDGENPKAMGTAVLALLALLGGVFFRRKSLVEKARR